MEVHGYIVISGVRSPLIWVITIAPLFLTPLLTTTHEPASKFWGVDGFSLRAACRVTMGFSLPDALLFTHLSC